MPTAFGFEKAQGQFESVPHNKNYFAEATAVVWSVVGVDVSLLLVSSRY
jgi:hypothetical protein